MSVLKINSSALVAQQNGTQANISRLRTLEQRFNEQLFNQPQAVAKVCDILKMIVTGFYNDKAPLGVLLFAGPTGVGKTELAKMMANELGIPFNRYDMSEFQHDHHVSRFLGSPPGYVGSQNGGELVNALKKTPVCVVLFDEIEKAHPSIFNIFLQLFDEGRLTDATGTHVSTKNVIFIMTTNMGTREFSLNTEKSQAEKQTILKSLFINKFSPELFNRIQHTVVFNSLDEDAFAKIAKKHLYELRDGISERKQLTITWDNQFEEVVSQLECDKDMGARGYQRKINDFVLPALANSYVKGRFFEGGQIKLFKNDGSNHISIKVLDKGEQSMPDVDPHPVVDRRTIFYNRQGLPAKNFKGKYAVRTAKCNGDGSHMDEPIKIHTITPDGDIIYYRKKFMSDEYEQDRLGPQWNDGKWMMPIPSMHPKEFFESLSSDIAEDRRNEYLELVRAIFKELKVVYLPDDNPVDGFMGLLFRVKGANFVNDPLCQKFDELEKMVGHIQVVEQAPSNKTLSSNYDLPFLQSTKRKRSDD